MPVLKGTGTTAAKYRAWVFAIAPRDRAAWACATMQVPVSRMELANVIQRTEVKHVSCSALLIVGDRRTSATNEAPATKWLFACVMFGIKVRRANESLIG